MTADSSRFLVIDHHAADDGDFRWHMTLRKPSVTRRIEVIDFVSEEACMLFVSECLAEHVEANQDRSVFACEDEYGRGFARGGVR